MISVIILLRKKKKKKKSLSVAALFSADSELFKAVPLLILFSRIKNAALKKKKAAFGALVYEG